jgi:UPF0755 protein
MSEYSRRHGAYGEPAQFAESNHSAGGQAAGGHVAANYAAASHAASGYAAANHAAANHSAGGGHSASGHAAEGSRFSRRNARYADSYDDGGAFDAAGDGEGDAPAMRPASEFSRSRTRARDNARDAADDAGFGYIGAGSSTKSGTKSRKKPGFSFSSSRPGSRFASGGLGGNGSGGDDDGYGGGYGGGGQHGYVGYSVNGMRRKSSPVRTVIVAVIALAVVGLLAFGGYNVLASFGLFGSATSASEEVEVFIPEGSATSEIARFLKDKNVIAKESSFISAVQQRGVESQLQPGKYTLRTNMTDNEAIDALIVGPSGSLGGNKLTIPEGLTLEATAAKVEAACGIPAADFIAEAHMADKYVAEFPFLAGVYNNSLEGFLYPKTYQVPVDATAEDVVRILLKQFAIEISGLDLAYAEGKNLNIYDIVIIASMIEKETAQLDERPLVSSVIYNRLHEGMKLQICATVVYAIGMENYDGHPLLNSDLEIDSPYNTYIVDSLPAGPICSPHISSIEAAAHPAETDYFYYVLTSEDGRHTFCRNEDEFAEANNVYHELFGVPN